MQDEEAIAKSLIDEVWAKYCAPPKGYIPSKTCAQCSGVFKPHKNRHTVQKYCCKQCSTTAQRLAYERAQPIQFQCAHCGVWFAAIRCGGPEPRKYCSDACGKAAWNQKNAETLRAKARTRAAKLRADDPRAAIESTKRWRERNRDKHLAAKKAQSERARRRRGMPTRPKAKHEAHVKAFGAWIKACTALASAHVNAWRKACGAAYFKHRYRNDPEFNAKEKLRANYAKTRKHDSDLQRYMACMIKRDGWHKTWTARVGYTMQELVAHLHKTIPKGRTWQEFMAGDLHIDHIVPRKDFDLQDEAEIRACWALGNLRLLDKHENTAKSAKRIFLL